MELLPLLRLCWLTLRTCKPYLRRDCGDLPRSHVSGASSLHRHHYICSGRGGQSSTALSALRHPVVLGWQIHSRPSIAQCPHILILAQFRRMTKGFEKTQRWTFVPASKNASDDSCF